MCNAYGMKIGPKAIKFPTKILLKEWGVSIIQLPATLKEVRLQEKEFCLVELLPAGCQWTGQK